MSLLRIKELGSQLARRDERIAELEKDADRYQWLRRKACIVGGKFQFINMPLPTYVAPDAACELDAKIDEEMMLDK